MLPRGRQVVVYSEAKTGKSLLGLDIAVRLAIGMEILGRPSPGAQNVLYLDMEMTESDLRERLSDMGFGPESDLSRLSYYMLPNLAPLDTPAGGLELVDLACQHDAALVVVDTTSRVLSGAENDADTMRAFYRHTGSLLKREGRTTLRFDHAGKDRSRGQRGSSAKADDVDVVWELTRTRAGLRLRATHRRQAWVPESLELTRFSDPLRHELRSTVEVTPEVLEIVKTLIERGVPEEWGRERVRAFLKNEGIGAANDALTAAIRHRKARP